MIVKYDEDNFSIKLYRNFVKGKLVGLMEVIPIDELLEVWADRKTEPQTCDDCIWSVCNYNRVPWGIDDEPQTERSSE